jgi:hypothetical protein
VQQLMLVTFEHQPVVAVSNSEPPDFGQIAARITIEFRWYDYIIADVKDELTSFHFRLQVQTLGLYSGSFSAFQGMNTQVMN